MQKHPALPAEPPQVFHSPDPTLTGRQHPPALQEQPGPESWSLPAREQHTCTSDRCAATHRVGCVLKGMKHIYKPWFGPQSLLPESPGWLRTDNGFLFSLTVVEGAITSGLTKVLQIRTSWTSLDILNEENVKRNKPLSAQCGFYGPDPTLKCNGKKQGVFFLVKKQTGNRSNGCTKDL